MKLERAILGANELFYRRQAGPEGIKSIKVYVLLVSQLSKEPTNCDDGKSYLEHTEDTTHNDNDLG